MKMAMAEAGGGGEIRIRFRIWNNKKKAAGAVNYFLQKNKAPAGRGGLLLFGLGGVRIGGGLALSAEELQGAAQDAGDLDAHGGGVFQD